MRKEILLSAAMLFGAGAPVVAQPEVAEPSTPIVEQEKLDVSGLLEAVEWGVHTDAAPGFFKRMERRAKENPNEYFIVKELPDGESITYHPRGVDKLPKVGYTHTQDAVMLNDPGGPLNAFHTLDNVWLQLGDGGSVGDDPKVVLYNFDEIHEAVDTYIRTPRSLRDMPWNDVPFRQPYAAVSVKQIQLDPNNEVYDGWLVGGIQNGFIMKQHEKLEIPKVGTDVAAS